MAGKRTDWLEIGRGKSYFHRVHRPLQCLIFISPLLLFYQIGSVIHPWQADQASRQDWHVVAFLLMLKFFAFFGIFGNIVPPLTVILMLLIWHLLRNDPWHLDWRLYLGMAGESLLWGLCIVVIGLAVNRIGGAPLAAAAATAPQLLPWQTEVVISVGAGIYEELIFRFVAINLLSMIFMDAMEIRPPWSIPLIIILSAVLFSAYHLLGGETFNAGWFVFRVALGLYLAGIYVYRGFGIVVGVHTVYDLAITYLYHR